MIYQMNKRVVGVALLGLAFAASTRPAHAQDANSWFDDNSDAPAVTANATSADAAPAAAPVAAPRPQVPYTAPAAPAAPGPQTPVQVDNVAETDPRAITEFRSTLDPYGTWVDDAKYGTVWVPNRDAVGPDFAPYVSAGHWALTSDNDWIWQSDYPFGGVVFHYGRWVWVPGVGWAWVAGRQYANAWVTWRVSSNNYGYIGWAPMAPAWGWYGGRALGLGWYPPSAYVFCPTRYAFSYRVHTYIVRDHYRIHDIAQNTRNYSEGRVQRVAATPHVLPANSAPPRGPSLDSARIPAMSAPASRVAARSAFAGQRVTPATSPFGADGTRRTFSAGPRPQSPSAYQSARPSAAPSNYRAVPYANPSMYARPRPAYTAPAASGYRPVPSASMRSFSDYQRPTHYSEPTRAPSFSGSARSYSTPSFHSSPSFNSAPSFRSAPSFSSAPSHSFQAPSRR